MVSDARYNDLKTDSLNMTYRPAAQSDWYLESLEVQAAGEPAASTSTVQAALAKRSRACR